MKVTLKIKTEDLNQSINTVNEGVNTNLLINTSKIKLQSVPTFTEKLLTLVFPSPIIVKGGTEGGGVSKLRDLDDVLISLPKDGDLLVFDGNQWINKADDYNDRFLRKDINDTARGYLTLLKGFITSGRATFKDTLGSEVFASGFSGTGWEINKTKLGENHLTVDNLTVRRTMNVYELIINQLNATNGSLWVSDSIKVKEVEKLIPAVKWITGKDSAGRIKVFKDILPPGYTFEYSDAWVEKSKLANLCKGYSPSNPEIHYTNNPQTNEPFLDIEIGETITDETGNKFNIQYYHSFYSGDFYKIIYEEGYKAVFRVNDLVKCQKWEEGIKIYNAIVTNTFTEEVNGVTINGCIIRLSDIVLEDTLIVEPIPTDTIVRIGNTVDVYRQGAIYLTSSEIDGPYIDILDKVNNPIIKNRLPTVRLGNLNGITDPAFGNLTPVQGTGIYASNGFFKGRQIHITSDGEELPVTVLRGEWSPYTIYEYGNQVTRKLNNVEHLYAAKNVSSLNKNKAPESFPEYWELITAGEKGDDGSSAKILRLVGPSIFYYKEGWKELITPKIVKTLDVQNLTPEDADKIHWYILAKRQLDNDEIWINYTIFAKALSAEFFPTDEEFNISIPQGYKLWNNNTLTIQACVGTLNNPTVSPEIYDIENLGKISSAESPYELSIQSSKGLQFKEGIYKTTVYALVYHKGKLVTPESPERKAIRLEWIIQDKEGNNIDQKGDIDEFIITNDDVNFKANFLCTVYSK